jgi:hypothetical protein
MVPVSSREDIKGVEGEYGGNIMNSCMKRVK